jgi:thiamine pyrophosphokinase
MRGILFTGGGAPDPTLAARFYQGYRYVVAADSGLLACERAGIVPDFIVGDMDSIPDPAALSRYSADRVRVWPRDKDYTDTELALGALKDHGVDEVILVGGGGGRIDHFLALRALFDRPFCPALWIGDESVCVAVGKGTPSKTVRINGLSPDHPVSVFAAGSAPHHALGAGFHWDIGALTWDSGEYSLSNRAESGSVSVSATEGRFFIVFPLAQDITVTRDD